MALRKKTKKTGSVPVKRNHRGWDLGRRVPNMQAERVSQGPGSFQPSDGRYPAVVQMGDGQQIALDERGRVAVESKWPQGGCITKEIDTRHYDVQEFTGYPVSTVGAGQWYRGQLEKQYTPVLQTSQFGSNTSMYDPTNPQTYPNPGTN